MSTHSSEQAAATDRDELAPRVATYWKALIAQGLPIAGVLALVSQYQTTLQQIATIQGMDKDGKPGLDLPDPPL